MNLEEVYTLDFTEARSKSVSPEMEASAAKVVRSAAYVDYSNKAAIGELLNLRPEALTVKLPFEGTVLTIDLVQSDFFGENFSVQSNDPSKVAGITTGLYYMGTIRGKQSVVGFSFFADEFNALINTGDVQDATIETGLMGLVDNPSRTHIIYSDDDLIETDHPACETESLLQYQEGVDRLSRTKVPEFEGGEKAMYRCVTYFWETSYNMYQSKGTTQAVTNYMTSLFNNFQILYVNESIGSRLNQLYIWTSADPYNNNLNTFSAQRSGFGANLATLFSTTGGGGVAWLDVLCGSSEYYKHGFCGSVGGNFPAVPSYSWPVNVTAHEVGHNLGSPHTHACSWSGGAIDGCGPAAGYSEGCSGPTPSGGGTIMSYCHLTSTGINLANGFGPQPGNLIRSRVNSCITLQCNETGGTDGGQTCTNAYESNNTQATAATISTGTTISAAIAAAGDNDYYKITTTQNTNNVFSLVGPSGVDFDMQILNAGGTVIGSGTSGSATETVTLNNQAAGTYTIRVYGYNNAFSATCYTLNATATPNTSCANAYEPNESIAAAATIPLATTISGAITTTTDNDYYKVTTTQSGTHQFSLVGPSGVDYDMRIYNSGGTQIGAGTGATATETVSLSGLAVGTYTIRIYGYNGANSTSCYTLNVARTGAAIADGAAGGNYTVYPNPVKDKLMVLSSDEEEALQLEIIGMNGQLLSTQQATGETAIDVSGLSPGVYFVRILSAARHEQIKFVKQ